VILFYLTGKSKQKEKNILIAPWTLGKEKIIQDSKILKIFRLHFRKICLFPSEMILLYVNVNFLVHKNEIIKMSLNIKTRALFRKTCLKTT
jgi:hypothetical protein